MNTVPSFPPTLFRDSGLAGMTADIRFPLFPRRRLR
jgi:hypothetical protein